MTATSLGVRRSTAIAAVALMIATLPLSARVSVRVEFDPAFDFTRAKTWAWNPESPGDVKMARTVHDDPEAMRRHAEPIIVEEVEKLLPARGLTAPLGKAPDLLVTYYLLMSMNQEAQTVGQFLPGATDWGLPPFPPATQSLKLMNQGSLVIDLAAAGTVVWRGVAQARIKLDATDKQRTALLREAVRDLLRRYPPGK